MIVEGTHVLCTPELTALFDIRVFVDTPADIRFIRRLLRDQSERGRSADSVVAQYLATVRPGHERLTERRAPTPTSSSPTPPPPSGWKIRRPWFVWPRPSWPIPCWRLS